MRLSLQIGDIQIELIESVKSKYFFLASESELFVNRQKVGSVGGFNPKEKIEGSFEDENGIEHTIEIEKTTTVGDTIFIYLDKKLVYSKTGTANNAILGCFGTLLILSLILLVILLIIILI